MDSQDHGSRSVGGRSAPRLVLTAAVPFWLVAGAASWFFVGEWMDAALTSVMGLATTMLVMAVFSQTGRVQLSPQREVALATGHTDRRTAFEHPYLRPFMMVLLSLSHRLAVPRLKDWLRRTLVTEGNRQYYTPEEYLAVTMATGLAAGGGFVLIVLIIYGQLSIPVLILGVVAGVGLALFQLRSRSRKRLREISKRVPYSLDLIALAMGAGATFTEAMETVVHEDPDDPFNAELGTVLAEMELGATRRQALQNLSARLPIEALQNIVASVIQAEQLGTPLGDVMHDEASLLRDQRSAEAENKAAGASVKVLFPTLLIMMACLLAVLGPMILKIVRGGMF
ncbi:MAG: type II secretion system F family protein [Phycisphaerae bacterium]|nr:type II secretion system F family protein [Phycisphaerae bacterium]